MKRRQLKVVYSRTSGVSTLSPALSYTSSNSAHSFDKVADKAPNPWFFRQALAVASALIIGLCTHSATAQDTNSISPPVDTAQADVMDGNGDASLADDLSATNQVDESNSVGHATAPGPDGRSRRLQRQKNRPRTHNDNSQSNSTAPTKGGALDYSAFRLITERNIFDPNRQPHAGQRTRPKTQDAFTLVGTMSYDKGDFAFFDGTSADYKKVLKPSDTIAGYKVLSISPDAVKLEHESKEVNLTVGSQLRKQEDGAWVASGGAGSYSANSETSSTQTESAPGGAEDDVMKRLMQRREKENSP